MNEESYRNALLTLLNTAAKDLDCITLLKGTTSATASLLAVATTTSGQKPEEAIEVLRHQLDVLYTFYLENYRNASRSVT